jgi:23S rRNA pseudouridine2605 synthase
MKPGHVALERALSKLGFASRTRGRELILAGKVSVNGVVRRDPLFPIIPERARIEVEGKRIEGEATRIFILHKPRGVVTTHSDEKGRKTVFDLFNDAFKRGSGGGGDVRGCGVGGKRAEDGAQPQVRNKIRHLSAVGRLDWATSGLLILTNDTRLSDWLTDPRNQVPRTYLVTVRGEMTEEKLARLRQGVRSRGELLRADQITLRKASGRESHLVVELSEGKNREIRRLFESIGHEVTRLKRISYGSFELGDLEAGEFREISVAEFAQAFPKAPPPRR